jgi:hypothetical protein
MKPAPADVAHVGVYVGVHTGIGDGVYSGDADPISVSPVGAATSEVAGGAAGAHGGDES